MIVSSANSRVKRIVQLQEKSRVRRKEKVFVAEGVKMFEEAPLERIQEIYIEETLEEGGFLRTNEKIAECRKKGIIAETVSAEVFRKMSDTQTPQGILCVVEMHSFQQEEIVEQAGKRCREKGKAPLFLILEDIQDPGNLGTILRTGEGAGVDGIFMTGRTVDCYNPKTIRSTMGSLYRVPFCYIDRIEKTVALLQQNRIRVYAAHLQGKQYYDEISYSEGSAFLIGNEGNGLKKETAGLADCYVKIPMEGQLESLNAAVSAALLLYQAAGEKRRKQKN